jgi:hypothetical protein
MPDWPCEALITLSANLPGISRETSSGSGESGRPEASISHGQSGGAGAIFSLDYFISAELDTYGRVSRQLQILVDIVQTLTVHESVILVCRNIQSWGSLAEEGNDGLPRVPANNRDLDLGWILLAGIFLSEGLCTDNIQSGDSKEAFGVEDTVFLEDLSGDWDGGVYRIRDDEYKSLGAMLCDSRHQVADDTSIHLEKIVTTHARLACWEGFESEEEQQLVFYFWRVGVRTRDSSRNDNNISASQCILQTIVFGKVTGDFSDGRDVRQIRSDAGGVDDIVESKLINQRACLQQKR